MRCCVTSFGHALSYDKQCTSSVRIKIFTASVLSIFATVEHVAKRRSLASNSSKDTNVLEGNELKQGVTQAGMCTVDWLQATAVY